MAPPLVRKIRPGWTLILPALIPLCVLGFPVDAGAAESIQFNRDIRPILSDNCFACHGPDKNTRKGDLRLDQAADATRAHQGKAAVVPGKPEASELIRRITTTDEEDHMPPHKSGKHLTPSQVNLLQRWISEGARFEGHWAYNPPIKNPLPEPATHGVENPIDRFVQARLQKEGLQTSPAADRRTLLRRLSFDLTGLPPTPSELDQFEKSRDPKAYAREVERLLASPHFGERMAIPWLDLVRYADTIGYHGDLSIEVWPYRDYVVSAFNRNIGFDQFTREQIAGDLLPNPTPEQKTASGYNRLNRISSEGGVQDKEFLAKYASDRVRTTATAWMGATLACAECHDHKFDPYTTRDFYQFAAFFADLKEKGFYDKGFSENDWGPSLRLATPEQSRRLQDLNQRISAVQRKLEAVTDDSLSAARQAWEARILALDRQGLLEWKTQTPQAALTRNGATLTIGENQTVTAGGANPDQEVYTVTLRPGAGIWTAIRLETLVDEIFPGNRIARAGVTYVITDFSVTANRAGGSERLPISHVSADQQGEGYPALAMIDADPASGWAITTGHSREHQAAFRFQNPVATTADTVLTVRIAQESQLRRATIGRFKIGLSTLDRPGYEKNSLPEEVLKAIRTAPSDRKEDQKSAIRNYYRKVAAELESGQWELSALQAARSRLLAQIPSTLVSEQSATSRTTRILPRGNWMDESGEKVQPEVPRFLQGAGNHSKPAGRLELADWLTSKENPLTARAFVNRLWKQFFGTGFTRTPEDLGAQGDWPVHAELFDWLAREFMEPSFRIETGLNQASPHAWDVKHLIRLIVHSSTYRQSSVPNPGQEEKDPLNRLLSRQSRYRLDAELVRDNALALSGLLERRVGGPSAKPFQPEGYYAPLNFPKREYVHEKGAGQYRRGLYTHWQRTFLHPSLVAFDAPSREECTAGRVMSNTPQQALVLLNDPVYVEAARNLAGRLLAEKIAGENQRLARAWVLVTGRSPQTSEIEVLKDVFDAERARFRASPQAAEQLISTGDSPRTGKADRIELAAWTSVARTLLNLHETITRP